MPQLPFFGGGQMQMIHDAVEVVHSGPMDARAKLQLQRQYESQVRLPGWKAMFLLEFLLDNQP